MVARDSPHASQPFGRFYPSPGPCLPEPLIRAPVLKSRPPSRAGATTFRKLQTKTVNCKCMFGRRGGLQAARAILSCRERAVLRPRSRPPSRAGRFPGGVHAAPTCNGTLRGKHQNHACQTAPRRGQDPALRLYGNCEQNRKYQFPSGRRGGLQAARAAIPCHERPVLHPRSRFL